MTDSLSHPSASNGDSCEVALRPGRCTLGQPVEVITNLLHVTDAPTTFFTYHVEFGTLAVQSDSGETVLCRLQDRTEKQRVLQAIKLHARLKGKRYAPLSDCKTLACDTPLHNEDELGFCIESVPFEARTGTQANLSFVKLAFDGKLPPSCRSSDQQRTPPELLAVQNAYVQKLPSTNPAIVQVGSNRFFPTNSKPITLPGLDPLEARPGYSLTVRETEIGLCTNINTTFTCFNKPQPVSESITQLLRMFRSTRREDVEDFLSSNLSGLLVKVDPSVSSAQSLKKIRAIGGPADETRIQISSNKALTVTDFYRTKYGVLLKRTDLPCVKLGQFYRELSEQTVWYPPELLTMVPDQSAKSILQQELVGSFINHATRKALDNRQKFENEGIFEMQLARRANEHGTTETVADLGFKVNSSLQKVQGRILPPPKVRYGKQNLTLRGASWNLKDVRSFCDSRRLQDLERLVILRIEKRAGFHQGKAYPPLDNCIIGLKQQMERHGLIMNPRLEIVTRSVQYRPLPIDTLEQDIEREFAPMATSEKKFFVLVVLPDDNKHVYGVVKRAADLKFGIKTSAMLSAKCHRKDEAYFSNVICKMVVKTGGITHHPFVESNLLGPQIRDPKCVMVVGADVRHGSTAPRMEGSPSIACVVGSVNETLIEYWASVRLQRAGQERIQDLQPMMVERFNAWAYMNRDRIPDVLIFYRDGVAESQVEDVRKTEIPAIFAAWESVEKFSKHRKLRLIFIVVTKRHHIRFYPTRNTPMDSKTTNVTSSLVVDRKITDPYEFDFFLQSHQAIRGTARPARYHVLRNDLALDVNSMIDFTNRLCFAVGAATKGVSYAAPAFLADKCCNHAALWLQYQRILERGRMESQEDYKDRCLVRYLKDDPLWNRNDRPGPWHKNLDRYMFWA